MALDSQASEGSAPDSRGDVPQQMAHQGTHRVEDEAAAEVDPTEKTTLVGHENLLLGAPSNLTLTKLIQRAGINMEVAQKFWCAMGSTDVQPDEVRFTDQDVAALQDTVALLNETNDSSPASASVLRLLRAQSYTMGRPVLWELETFVMDLSGCLGLDDTAARLIALDRIDGLVELLSCQLIYV